MILVNGKIYLADSRQKYANLDSFGYEWFYWDFTDINPILLKEYNDKLNNNNFDNNNFDLNLNFYKFNI